MSGRRIPDKLEVKHARSKNRFSGNPLAIVPQPGQVILAMNRRGFCIYINTLSEGSVPSVKGSSTDDPSNNAERICVYATEREAQLEIVDFMMTRLQEFIDGERDFDDAVTLEEYVVAVDVMSDGVIVDGDGNEFSA